MPRDGCERTASVREDRGIAIVQTGKTKAAANAIVVSAIEKRDAECQQRGKKCTGAEAELADARVQAAVAQPGKQGGYLGRFEGVSELALPLMLLLLGFAFIAYAEQPSRRDSEQTDFPAEGDDPLPGRELFEPIQHNDPGQRGRKVASFVTEYRARHGRAPRTCEVSKALNLPKASASRWRARAIAG